MAPNTESRRWGMLTWLVWVASAVSLGACISAVTTGAGSPVSGRVADERARIDPVAPDLRLALPTIPMDEPDAVASDSAGVARLVALAHVWHTVSLYHPSVVARGAAWDSALVRVVPAVRAAREQTQLADAYTVLVSVLRDAATRVVRDPVDVVRDTMVNSRAERVRVDLRSDSVAVVRVPTDAALDADDERTLANALPRLPAYVIVDLRAAQPRGDDDGRVDPVSDTHSDTQTGTPFDSPVRTENDILRVNAFVERTGLARALTALSFAAPAERVRRVGGVMLDANNTPRFGGGWMRNDAPPLRGTATIPHRVVIVANRHSTVPRDIATLISAARATLVADGGMSDASLVTMARVPITSGLAVRARAGELVHPDGTFGLVADTVIARPAMSPDSTVVRLASQWLRANTLPRATRGAGLVRAPAALPVVWDTAAYPPMGARLLAGFRVWSAMRSRHAHRDQYDDDADAIFARVIPRLEAATNSAQFVTAIADLVATMDDAEATLVGPWRETALGTSSAPFRVRLLEGRAIITDLVRDSTTRALGLTVGTEITAADGYPMAAWLTEQRRLIATPNEWTRHRDLMRILPLGPDGEAPFKVRDANGRERAISVPRRVGYASQMSRTERADSAAVRRLTVGVGYIDVERVTARALDSAFRLFADERAVLLDLRGTLSVDASSVLAHVASQPRFVARREISRIATAPCLVATLRDAVTQCVDERADRAITLAVDTTGHFRGRVYALIDERTQGAMERLALAMESSTPVTFLGSASAGAASVAVALELPGWLTLGVPVDEVRRADGGQIHRVGIAPSVDVRPTVRAVREGRDDVLERALQTVMQQLDLPVRRRR